MSRGRSAGSSRSRQGGTACDVHRGRGGGRSGPRGASEAQTPTKVGDSHFAVEPTDPLDPLDLLTDLRLEPLRQGTPVPGPERVETGKAILAERVVVGDPL